MHISRSFQYLKASLVKARLRIEKTRCCIDASGQVSLDTTGTPHVTGFSAAVPVTSHQHSVSVCVSGGSRHHTIKKSKGAAKAVPTLNFFLFLWDPKCLPWDHRALRKPAVETPVNATTGSSFRATPTYLPTVEMCRLDLVHHTNCQHTHAPAWICAGASTDTHKGCDRSWRCWQWRFFKSLFFLLHAYAQGQYQRASQCFIPGASKRCPTASLGLLLLLQMYKK